MDKQPHNTLFALALGIAVLLTPSLASADSSGFFLEAGGYYTQLDTKISDDDIDWDDDIEDVLARFDDSSAGYNLGAGWRFNKWLSVDAGYWDLGKFDSEALSAGDSISYETTAYTLGGMVSVPLWILDIYGRAGVAMWDTDSRYIETDGTDAYYGVGAALNVFGSIDLYAEYVRFDLDAAIDTVGLGVRFTF